MSLQLNTLNQRFYQSRCIAEWYAAKEFTLPEEQAFLDRHGNAAVDARHMLDIGIGAGRTTRFLLPRAARYEGVDYSPEMIAAAQARFPHSSLMVRDARDLSAYADGEFDTVIFSFNGIDCLSHEGRLTAMAEIHRVLKPDGWFVFSAHNRNRVPASAFARSNLSISKHPLHMWKNLCRYVLGMVNWLSTKSLAYEASGHALRHDSSNIYGAPIYYIDKACQREQLARLGFEVVSIFDGQGRETTVAEPDVHSAWILFACRKSAIVPARQD